MALEHLLKRQRFWAHPFSTWIAEDERDSVSEWFIDPPFLRALLGDTTPSQQRYIPSSDLIFGKRGSGKTALRIKLEQELSKNLRNALVVRYVGFGPALTEGPRPSLQSHVEEIIRLATVELVGFLAEDVERYRPLGLSEKAELLGLIQHYFDSLPPEVRSRYQSELSPIAGRLVIIAKSLGRTVVDLYNGIINIIRIEKIQPTSWAPSQGPSNPIYPITRLQRLWTLATAAGIDSVWVMVDGIDEAPNVRTPQEIFNCVADILLSQGLIEFRQEARQAICFKVFLTHPDELKPLLKAHDFRFDRITAQDINLQRSDLNSALVKRLSHFSNRAVIDFDRLCESNARGTHDRMIDQCGNRPRTLFRMGHEILSIFNRSDDTGATMLDKTSIDEGIRLALAATSG